MKQTEEDKRNTWGVASLITSIIGLLLFLAPYLGLPLSIFAVVASSKQNKTYKTGVAQAGNVMGIIGIVINSVMLIFVLIALLFVGMTG
jgi:hypothetical protein